MALSMCLFLSLALVKRYSELLLVQAEGNEMAVGRGYRVVDLETIFSFGIASGFGAVLVFAFYINSVEIISLYRYPDILWLICPLLLYWISRIWLLARRNLVHDDPVLFAIEDRRSLWLFFTIVVIVLVAV
jgi:hypothetical protein